MDMLMSLLSGGLGGGLLGAVGTITQGVLNFKDKKREREYNLKVMEHEHIADEAMAKLEMKQVQIANEAAIEQSLIEDLDSARSNDATKYLSALADINNLDTADKSVIARRLAWVDMARGFVRPIITYISTFAVIGFVIASYAGIVIPNSIFIGTLNNIALAAITFWFGAKVIKS